MDIQKAVKMFSYCPDSGDITYRVKTRYHSHGDKAGRLSMPHGYIRVSFSGVKAKAVYAHRLAWVLYFGRLPKCTIDHINGVRTDNRISNLREATVAQNLQNIRIKPRKKYDLPMGVCFHRRSGKYKAQLKLNYKTIWLGYFDDPSVAHEAYLKAKRELHEFSEI